MSVATSTLALLFTNCTSTVAVALLEVAMKLERHRAFSAQHFHPVAALLLGVAQGQAACGAEVVQHQAHGVQAFCFAHLDEAPSGPFLSHRAGHCHS